MRKRTKALDISRKVRDEVWRRDNHCCILCGSPYAMPNAHFIPRSHGGLGIEKNVVTLCLSCHDKYDNSTNRPWMKEVIRDYLSSHYAEWQENELIYKKYQEA